jgi:uncharacterized protein YegP (UPF0339 family)
MAGENDTWEIYTDKRGEFRWRRKAANGNIVGSSCEGYSKKVDCKTNAQRHGMDGNPEKYGASDKWEIYKDKRSEFRWRRMARNGEITGAASESYAKKNDCEANARRNGMAI